MRGPYTQRIAIWKRRIRTDERPEAVHMTPRRVFLAAVLAASLGTTGCSDPAPPDPAAGIPKLDQRARALPPPETACAPVAPSAAGAPGATVPRCALNLGRAVGALAVPPEGSPAIVSLIHAATASWTLPAMTYALAFDPLPAEQEARAIVASATRDRALFAVGTDLLAYAPSSGKVAGRVAGPGGIIHDLAWTSDGAWIVVAAGGKAFVLDATGKVVRALAVDGSALHVAVAADGTHTAVANDVGAIRLLGTDDAAARTLTPSLQPVEGLAFVGDLLWVAGSDGTLRAFATSSGDEVKRIDAGAALTRLAVSADGRRAAVAARDRVIRVYALPAGAPVGSLTWHRAQITALAWGADGTLLSGDGDGALAVWDPSATRP
ncbi:hypothetical protein K2Z84_02830 [Candidatus Binatia bacterium]|nr:hypothetical protein [Candidatus Binatia bacterium]